VILAAPADAVLDPGQGRLRAIAASGNLNMENAEMTSPLMQPAVLIVIGSMIAFMAGLLFVSIEDTIHGRQD
jgi:type II secretory pathway component PulF